VSFDTVKFAVYLGVALIPSLVLHEYAHAWMAVRRGDASPRFHGRLTLNPRPLIDPFGSVILPGLLLILRAVGVGVVPFAYAKPMPRNPAALPNPDRDTVIVAMSGPLVNLGVAIVAGALLRALGPGGGEVSLFLFGVLLVNVAFFVFYLMPIPGLDGAVILSQYLPPRAREVYRNLDQYLPLWMLLIFFLLGAPVLFFVEAISNAVCNAVAGFGCF
jgi:Zn-dependent protease